MTFIKSKLFVYLQIGLLFFVLSLLASCSVSKTSSCPRFDTKNMRKNQVSTRKSAMSTPKNGWGTKYKDREAKEKKREARRKIKQAKKEAKQAKKGA